MFKFFNRNSYIPKADKPGLNEEDRNWVEHNMLWLVEVFGLDRLINEPFFLPTFDYFPYKNLKEENQFRQLYDQLCRHWELNPDEIKVTIFDDIQSKQWNNLIPQGSIYEAKSGVNLHFGTEQHRYIVRIARSNFENPELLTIAVAHELALIKMLDKDLVRANDQNLQPLADLATIYGGFGIFLANCCETKDNGWYGRYGYLLNEVISYANALVCHIAGKDAHHYSKYLNSNTRSLFLNDFTYLQQTNDTACTKKELEKTQALYAGHKAIQEGYKTYNFNQVIEAANKLLPLLPNSTYVFGNIGYALLLQKKYQEAIEYFNKEIDVDPYHDYSFNNRGYCWLQLGDVDRAFIDLQASFEMNPANSFSWRNMGAYYLHSGDYTKALEYFEEALVLSPKTELIHFYLGHAHAKLGNTEKSKASFDKSKELNEHNDSMLD
jgi:tetratricopeptide (TPR) repeat protein